MSTMNEERKASSAWAPSRPCEFIMAQRRGFAMRRLRSATDAVFLYYCGESNLISGSAKERLDLLREIIGAIGLVEQVHIIDR
jgi:hypothetical protein